jgi:hypothetical protein
VRHEYSATRQPILRDISLCNERRWYYTAVKAVTMSRNDEGKRKGAKERLLVFRFLVNSSARYTWHSLKNCVKLAIGRRPYFHDDDLFFRQYLLQLLGLRPITAITCAGFTSEGPGSQALMIMWAINFARASGLSYMHTPFSSILGADRPMQEWTSAWEKLFSLGEGERGCNRTRQEIVNYCYVARELALCFGWHGRSQELTNGFTSLIPEFRRKYYTDRSPRVNGEVRVAVNFRRGEVSAESNSHLFTSTDTVLRTAIAVRSILDSGGVRYRMSIPTGSPANSRNSPCSAPGFPAGKTH